MTTYNMTTACAFEDMQTVRCFGQEYGCAVKSEGPGPCATLVCSEGERFVCHKTPESELGGMHDVLGENRIGYLIDDPCHCC